MDHNMPEVTNQPLPSGPTTLCFNKEEFMRVRCQRNPGQGNRVGLTGTFSHGLVLDSCRWPCSFKYRSYQHWQESTLTACV